MKRQSPLKALQVAQLRCDAAVTITITGEAGSGKSTAAEIISRVLAGKGYNVATLESDDSIQVPSHLPTDTLDNRLYLVAVEDSKITHKRDEQPEPATEKSECDGGCEDCDGKDIPPMIKAILVHALSRASRQGM